MKSNDTNVDKILTTLNILNGIKDACNIKCNIIIMKSDNAHWLDVHNNNSNASNKCNTHIYT